MKKRSRIATACIAGVLATGLATAPAHAQGVEPNSSSQAIGDALVGSRTTLPGYTSVSTRQLS